MIIHLDADAFYVSVEQAERPELRGKPVAVGGERRGIIASASYEARALGVYTPMPSAHARKLCPELIIIRGSMEKYGRVSKRMFAIIEDFTPYIERTSIDEGYFEVSGHRSLTPRQIGEQIKARLRAELGITVSLGIGSSKLVAQIASKLRKPDALVEVPRGGERDFLAPLECRWLPGIGPKFAERLRMFDLHLVREIATAPFPLLIQAAGNEARRLRAYAEGRDERPLLLEHDDAKSYGTQETFDQNIANRESVHAILIRMADRLMARVREDGKTIRTVTVKVRYPNFRECAHSLTLGAATDLETDIYPYLGTLLDGAWKERLALRLASLRFSQVGPPIRQAELPLGERGIERARQTDASRLLDQLHAMGLPLTRGHDLD